MCSSPVYDDKQIWNIRPLSWNMKKFNLVFQNMSGKCDDVKKNKKVQLIVLYCNTTKIMYKTHLIPANRHANKIYLMHFSNVGSFQHNIELKITTSPWL